ncbi:hypothetical protein C8J56DRAFT_778793 [Mycena floridula]|nr:hypothetical protein C8J56DRAFT_778793 [Mycena floridula]
MVALLGDGKGLFRVHIFGNSGSGKARITFNTTLGAELASILDVPFISLDRLFWNPGWQESTSAEFHEKVNTAMAGCEKGWVIEGNYERRLGGLVSQAATDIIWLDPPLALYFPRLVIRTFRHLFGYGEPCSPGCKETFRSVFLSKDSIIWWCLSQHAKKRREGQEKMRQYELNKGTRRLGGWGNELKSWISQVKDLTRGR